MKQHHIFSILLLFGILYQSYSQTPEVIITEIMQNPSAVDDDFGEWFEIYNYGSAEVDLNGWTISDNDNDLDTISTSSPLIILPGEYMVLGINADNSLNGNVALDYQYKNIALANSEDELILIDIFDNEIDRVEWDNGVTFPDPSGASMSLGLGLLENELGEDWCESVTPYGDGDLGTPGALNDCEIFKGIQLRITEVFPGQEGTDLTMDWLEIKNLGNETWDITSTQELAYDSNPMTPNDIAFINGLTIIEPGASAIVVRGNANDASDFRNVWREVIDLSFIEIGYGDGNDINESGGPISLYTDGNYNDPSDVKTYPPNIGFDGRSYDFELDTFSFVGNENGAVATKQLGGDGTVPNIGSPGNGKIIPARTGLIITESFSGQSGEDLTEDWFEISNVSNVDWIAADNPPLYYDDDSQDPADAAIISGLTEIQVGRSAIVVISDTISDAERFREVWSEVFDLDDTEIVISDGAGLNAGGDAVTLWSGDPNVFAPINVSSYPDTEDFDGQSYDHAMGEFSEENNLSGAKATLQLGGNDGDVPNIGSPGAIFFDSVDDIFIDPSLFNVFPNPTNNTITIEQLGDLKLNGVQIFNMNGQLLLHSHKQDESATELDLSSFNPGTYFINLITSAGIMTNRIVKAK